jgi:glycosyltransferase involved in cell wall biosynthesis
LFIDSLEAGGAERTCLNLCNAWAKQKVSVELLLVRATGPFLPQLDPGVTVHDFNAAKARNCFWSVSRHLRASPHIPVLIFGFHLAAGLLAARLIGLHRAPVIYREGSSPRANIKPSRHWAYRWLIARADKIIAQNRSAQRELESLGVPAEKITVIPNPRESSASPPLSNRRETKESPLFLGVGRLSPEKGFDRLIRAFQRFQSAFPAARLVLLGEGVERGRLERLIAELGLEKSVSLPGFVPDPGSWYQQASVFALSSRYEGQPNALIEAILDECPVVCAAGHGGTVELMREIGLEDCLVPDDQFEQQFGNKVRQVLAFDGTRWQSAREKLAKLTDFETVVQQYLNVCGVDRPASAAVR